MDSDLTASASARETFVWESEESGESHKTHTCVGLPKNQKEVKGQRSAGLHTLRSTFSSYLPFFVMIISVPTELNCFHSDAFSSSIFTSSFWVLAAAGSLGAGGGASSLGGRALAATSQAEGNNGMWAEASRSEIKLKW